MIVSPDKDVELLEVYEWLRHQQAADKLMHAVDASIRYVLDGARTWRFDLTSDKVDSDERSSVGTKLQYHVIEQLKLEKGPPLDTVISGVPVEIKGTVRNAWMIPREGQCQVTLMVQIDAQEHRFRALLMRTHRAWLNGKKGNRDLKRSPRVPAVREYALEVAPWKGLPPEPLRLLNQEQLSVVFGSQGQVRRLTALFGYLPETVIPRTTIETVGATNQDTMRRARQAKPWIRTEHRLVVLVGTWLEQRSAAMKLRYDISGGAWVAVPESRLLAIGYTRQDFRRWGTEG